MKNIPHKDNGKAGSGHTLRISGLATGILMALLAVVVIWTFFMGFIVGSGQSPARHMEAMTGMLQRENSVPEAKQKSTDSLPDSNESTGERDSTGQPVTPAVPSAAGNIVTNSVPAAPASEAPPSLPAPKAEDFPFARPSGEGLTAWGIKVATSATGPNVETPGAKPPAVQPDSQGEALYDFVFQTAAFRSRADADALRGRLEDRGIRSRVQPSGKVHLVMVMLRGSQREADNLMEELQRMKLGKSIQLSRKVAPVLRGGSIR